MTYILFYIHPTAEVSSGAHIGAGTRIWSQVQVREYAHIGEECNIGKGVYIGAHVRVGSRVKIQNYALVYEGVTLEDGVFVGAHVCFTNDLLPRAITPDGKLKGTEGWEVTPTLVKYGASIGAGAVILCGVTISVGLWLLPRCWPLVDQCCMQCLSRLASRELWVTTREIPLTNSTAHIIYVWVH